MRPPSLSDRLGLDGRIDRDPFKILGRQGSGLGGDRQVSSHFAPGTAGSVDASDLTGRASR